MNKEKIIKGLKILGGVLAFFMIGIILINGLTPFFAFLPADWGSYDEDGEFEPYKETIPIYLSMGIAGLLFYIIYRFFDEKKKNIDKDFVIAVLNKNCELDKILEKRDKSHIHYSVTIDKSIISSDNYKTILEYINISSILSNANDHAIGYLEKQGFFGEKARAILSEL